LLCKPALYSSISGEDDTSRVTNIQGFKEVLTEEIEKSWLCFEIQA